LSGIRAIGAKLHRSHKEETSNRVRAARGLQEEKKKQEKKRKMDQMGPLPVRSLNHISRLCGSLSRSLDFYTKILGFFEVKRPGSLNVQFEGAW
jgi:hypothetical protein